jgi:hypothetical protein
MTSVTTQPAFSGRLMTATYALGGIGFAVCFHFLAQSDKPAVAAWASAFVVGTVGVLSFVRHSVFHRSDAARMGWDYGRRNDFQIEVGLANLAFGLAAIAAWAFGWGMQAQGTIVIGYGIYMLGAVYLHASELHRSSDEGGHRFLPLIGTVSFAALLIFFGVVSVNAT